MLPKFTRREQRVHAKSACFGASREALISVHLATPRAPPHITSHTVLTTCHPHRRLVVRQLFFTPPAAAVYTRVIIIHTSTTLVCHRD